MKKIMLGLFLAVGIFSQNYANNASLVIAHDKPNEIKANIKYEDNIANIISNQTQKFSSFFYNLGVTKINLNSNSFYYSTHKEFVYNGEFYNLENFKFKFTDRKLILDNSFIEFKLDGIYLNYDNNSVNFNTISEMDLKKIENYILYITYFELVNKNGKVSFTNEEIEKLAAGSCAWWNTLTITGIGRTQGAADADLWYATTQAANSGQLKGCTSIGGVEHTSFGIIQNSSQSFCCSRLFPSMSIY